MQAIERIVFVESTNDKVALNRRKKIQNSAALKDYTVSFVFAIDQRAENLHPGALTRAFGFGEQIPLVSIAETLFSSLAARVLRVEPQLVLIYTGFVFKQFHNDYYLTLKRIKQNFPDVRIGRFGVDTTVAQDAPDGVFDRTREVKAIETLFLDHVLGSHFAKKNKLKFSIS